MIARERRCSRPQALGASVPGRAPSLKRRSTLGGRSLQSANGAFVAPPAANAPRNRVRRPISSTEGTVHPVSSGTADDVDYGESPVQVPPRGIALSALNFETSADLGRCPRLRIESARRWRERSLPNKISGEDPPATLGRGAEHRTQDSLRRMLSESSAEGARDSLIQSSLNPQLYRQQPASASSC